MEKEIATIQSPPLGKLFSMTAKLYLGLLNAKLNHLDIERSYYALVLIESGRGDCTQNQLANQMEIDKVSVVRIVDYLTAHGYVKRIRSSSDQRKYCLTLTEKAQKVVPDIRNAINQVTDLAFTGMTEIQKSEFVSTVETIKNNLRNTQLQVYENKIIS